MSAHNLRATRKYMFGFRWCVLPLFPLLVSRDGLLIHSLRPKEQHMAGFPESVDIDSKMVLQYILTGLSTKQLEKMYTDLYRFIAVNGGTTFGMDWTTIHSQWPVTAEAMWRVHKELELRYIDPAKQR